ncbi:MAG: hypothetical protein P8O16_04885 [Algoriphagus sp.]|uniref:hypothetical protein n=1 Tax=Algoriphagus sp. TaxID=1872435 RepID=UPI00262D1184|nr:hypothetical protein [Algoriphagus sp.]MDG1276594.1 hypothetical protein [Algoriphagus sp.]
MKKQIFLLFLLMTYITVISHAQLPKLKIGGKKDSTEVASEPKTPKVKSAGGSNLMGKILTKTAMLAGSLGGSAFGMVSSTDNLEEVVMTGGVWHNLRNKSVGTVDMTFFGDWSSGGNMTMLSFTQKSRTGWTKIEGDITVNGKIIEGDNFGIYSSFEPANLSSPKEVLIKTNSGQEASFTIPAASQTFELLSINGQNENPSVDFSQDVTLELSLGENFDKNIPMFVQMTARVLGISTFYPVGYFEPATTLVIPAAAFRNIGIDPTNDKLANYSSIYLEIARAEILKPTDLIGEISIPQLVVNYADGRSLNIVKGPEMNNGIKYKGTEKFQNGGMDYDFLKPNAFYSRPLSQIKKAGVLSLSITGTTYVQGKTTSSSSSFSAGGTTYTSTTTTTTSASFPQIADELWEDVLESFYNDFTKIIESEYNTTFVPIDMITDSDAYQNLIPYSSDDENTTTEFQYSYKNTVALQKVLPFVPLTGGPNDVMKETGVNALFKIMLDLKIAFDRGNPVMIPTLNVELLGVSNGDPNDVLASPTKYFQGEIVGDGVRYPAANLSKEDLDKVIRKSNLLDLFQRSIQELKTRELANPDYQTVWEKSFNR